MAWVGVALSGCVYDVSLGYPSGGYYDDVYGCDYRHGFNNGYGGGWYDNYWRPGYGFFLLDNIGRRYPMRDRYRRYWGEKRHDRYRENYGRDGDGTRYQRRNRGNTDGAAAGTIGWSERHRDGVRDGEQVRSPRDGRVDRRRGDDGRRADAVAVPNIVTPYGQPGGVTYGDDDRPSGRRGSAVQEMNTVRPPLSPRQRDATSARNVAEHRPFTEGHPPQRQRAPEGGVERPE